MKLIAILFTVVSLVALSGSSPSTASKPYTEIYYKLTVNHYVGDPNPIIVTGETQVPIYSPTGKTIMVSTTQTEGLAELLGSDYDFAPK